MRLTDNILNLIEVARVNAKPMSITLPRGLTLACRVTEEKIVIFGYRKDGPTTNNEMTTTNTHAHAAVRQLHQSYKSETEFGRFKIGQQMRKAFKLSYLVNGQGSLF